MSRILVAATLAVVIMAAPAMAQELESPWPQDLTVNIEVAPIAEFHHAGAAEELDLAVYDAGSHFGKALAMRMLGNVDFDVWLEVKEANNTIPDDVRLDIIINANIAQWENMSNEIADGLRRYNAPIHGGNDTVTQFMDAGGTAFHIGAAGGQDSIPNTLIWEHRLADHGQSANVVDNLYSLYAGHNLPAQDDGTVLVEYTLQVAPD